MGRIYYNDNGVILENSKILFVDDYSIPIYWGTYTGRTVDEQYILNNFQSEIENIGSPDGKLRHFLPTGYTYSFFAIPDINIGEKIVNIITYNQIPNLEDKCSPLGNVVLTYYYTDYQYYQSDPQPDCGDINYGKITINSNNYRLYRTLSRSSSLNSLWIYSF